MEIRLQGLENYNQSQVLPIPLVNSLGIHSSEEEKISN